MIVFSLDNLDCLYYIPLPTAELCLLPPLSKLQILIRFLPNFVKRITDLCSSIDKGGSYIIFSLKHTHPYFLYILVTARQVIYKISGHSTTKTLLRELQKGGLEIIEVNLNRLANRCCAP